MFKQLRSWLISRSPLPPPKIIEVPCDNLKSAFGEFASMPNVNIPLLTRSHISDNLCQISVLIPPQPVFTRLSLPQLHHVPINIAKPNQKGRIYPSTQPHHTKTQSQHYNSTRSPDEFDLLPPYLNPPLQDTLKLSSMWLDKIKPFDYQIQGIIFLAKSPSALLGDEMGLGKTIQAIVALWAIFARGEVFKGLIVCRLSLLSNWERELEIWAAKIFIVQRVHGAKNEREQMWQTPASIYLTTYDTLLKDIERIALLKTKFQHGAIILDEVQDIKTPTTQRNQAIRQIQAKYKWGLSGTPIENKVEDVVTIFNYLKPDLFYRQPKMSDLEIKQHIKPYFFRRRIKDVQTELPKLINHVVPLDLTPQQRLVYDHTYKTGRNELKQPNITPMHVFKLISKLKQICNYDIASQTSCKLDYILDELETIIASGEKALIFSQYTEVTTLHIMPRLKQFNPAIYNGSLSNKQREQTLDRFQNEATPQVLLISTKAGGVGLNLQRANHVFHFDHLWNPAAQNQATGRAYRTGQTKTVFAHNIFTKNTIEARIQQVLHQKQTLFDTIIDDLSAEYEKGKFTEAELFDLFDLPPPRK